MIVFLQKRNLQPPWLAGGVKKEFPGSRFLQIKPIVCQQSLK
jgi:hypothetical protein